MNEYKRMLIADILDSSNTAEKIFKYQLYKDILGDCKIILFDEESSNLDLSFSNYKVGKCGIYGLGDYTKTWIINSRCTLDKQYIEFGKTVDFDLNIFTYLNKIVSGRPINKGISREEIIEFFNYIKENGFQSGIATALIERAAKDVEWKILVEMLKSYIRFEKIGRLDEPINRIHLNLLDYMRIWKICKFMNKQVNENIRQYDAVCCCVMKAYLIKKYDEEKDLYVKVDKFIKYCLRVLNCYFEKEIMLLSLYILDDIRTKETFKKLNKVTNIQEKILNVSWDIYHIRLLEQIMLSDNIKNKERVILPYFATADKGLIDAMKINPLKAFVILDNYPIPFHSIKVEEICRNEEVLHEIGTMSAIRSMNVRNIDFSKIKKQLLVEIGELQTKKDTE